MFTTFELFGIALWIFVGTNVAMMVWFKRLHPLCGLSVCLFVMANASAYSASLWYMLGVIVGSSGFTHLGGLFAFRSARKAKRRAAFPATANRIN